MPASWALVASFVTLLAPPAAPPPHIQRLRPADGAAARALDRGLACCPTIVALVRELEASDLIVYVRTGYLDNPATARTALMGAVTRDRYLRITLHQRALPEQLIELLGHELQHAIEIAREPAVRDATGMVALYRRIGLHPSATNRFETQLARQTGDRVRAEIAKRPSVAAFNAAAAADSSRRTPR